MNWKLFLTVHCVSNVITTAYLGSITTTSSAFLKTMTKNTHKKSIIVNNHHDRKHTTQLHQSNDPIKERDTSAIDVLSSKGFTNVAVATALFCSTLFMGNSISSSSTISQMIRPPEVSAAVAPLADVGLREFLVKDGKEFLRLGLPTSLPTSEDPAKLGDTGRIG